MPDAPVTYISNLVVERELDFVFGTDTDIIPFPIVHKKPITEQSVSTDVLTSDDAIQVAEMVFNNFLGGKQFCNSSYVNVANPAATLLDFCYQITGTATIVGEDCVLVSAYSSEEEILSGMESGNVLAVSKDKTLCFSKNVANGGWTFVWDDNEKAIF